MLIIYFPVLVSLFVLVFTGFVASRILTSPIGKTKGSEITKALYEGVVSYATRQYRAAGLVSIPLFFLLFVAMGWRVAFGFFIGAALSAVLVFLGIIIPLEAAPRVVKASEKGLAAALDLSYKGGLVFGLLAASLALLIIASYYFLTGISGLVALVFGAGLVSLFFKIGGGIYAKAASLSIELSKKKEKGAFEHDYLHPASIARQVGKNVGDLASIALDIFETYCVAMVSVMLLGALLYPKSPQFILLPLFAGSIFLLTSVIGSFFARLPKNKSIMGAMYKGIGVSMLLSLAALYPLISNMMAEQVISIINLYVSCLAGLMIAAGTLVFVEYYVSKKHGPTKKIIQSHAKGQSANATEVMGLVMQSAAVPILLIVFGAMISFWLAGVYGVALAALSMLSLSPMITAVSFYGPVAGNATQIASQTEEPQPGLKSLEELKASSVFAKAMTASYAIVSSALASLVLFWAYSQRVADEIGSTMPHFDLANPMVVAGLLIGGLFAYIFVSFLAIAVGKAAGRAATDLQKRATDDAKPENIARTDYAKDVRLITRFSMRGMIIPVAIPLVLPLLVGFLLGAEALGGLLIGALITGLFLAMAMAMGGTLWSGARKYVDEGAGAKGNLSNQGVAMADASKEATGPAINSFMKMLGLVALLIAVFLV
ncbi:sodium/proton-translocating pyrophosphatase [Candidatus Parcubacteria bacterium]|nr:sodium/proton-translocating pyrophosphatase [Candidatus Parcubacteria bacterium]